MIETSVPKLSDVVKAICAGYVNSLQLNDAFIGTVTSVAPLKISVDSQTVLSEKFLLLTNAVKEYAVDISVSWKTDEKKHKHGNGNDGQDTTETNLSYDIKGRKKITVHNGLTLGEKVLLLRVHGGQNYIVIDRLSEIKTIGESI